jgi:hypothetical protein
MAEQIMSINPLNETTASYTDKHLHPSIRIQFFTKPWTKLLRLLISSKADP